MGDSFYQIPVFVDFNLRRAWRRNTQIDIKKNYHMGDIKLISRSIYDEIK
jgi:hypothetical protein